MKMRHIWFGMPLAAVASALLAGIPVKQVVKCPVGGKKFTVMQTMSCSSSGATSDFFLKVDSSCDFVTRLPQCPDNALPLYKDFTKEEVVLLQAYVTGDEFRALSNRSRFARAKKVDDFLISKGSTPGFDFWNLLQGLKYDRASTLGDPEYMRWLQEKGTAELAIAKGVDAAAVRLVLAYVSYLSGDFAAASVGLDSVRSDSDQEVKDNPFVSAYLDHLGKCVAARDVKLCPPEAKVFEGNN